MRPFARRIDSFFDALELLTRRLPVLEKLIVQVLLILLTILGAIALLRGRP